MYTVTLAWIIYGPLEKREYQKNCSYPIVHVIVFSYNKAREIKATQDQYCNSVLGGDWATLINSPFPEDLRWEALVDVLRGRVKVQVHCYEAVDLDDFVRVC